MAGLRFGGNRPNSEDPTFGRSFLADCGPPQAPNPNRTSAGRDNLDSAQRLQREGNLRVAVRSALAQNDVPRMESTLNELQESLQKVGQAVYGGGQQQQPPGSGPGAAGGQQPPPPSGPGPDDDNTVEGNFREV